MRLYHSPGSRSTRVLWLLEEIGAPYEITEIGSREERQTPEHRARHPLGRVPVVEEEGGHVFESAAIALHLADQHPEADLIPPVGTHERALVYQWTIFAMTEVESAIVAVYMSRDGADEAKQAALERFRAAAKAVEDALAGKEFLVGDRFTVADVVTGGVLHFAKGLDLLEGLPNLIAYTDRLESRPARQRAYPVPA